MKITSKEFRAMYSGLNKIIPRKKSPMQSVSFTIHDEWMTVEAFNGLEAINYSFGASSSREGTVEALNVQFHSLRDLSKVLSGTTSLVFRSINGELVVDLVNQSDTTTLTFPADGSPVAHTTGGTETGKEVNAKAFHEAYFKCLSSVSQDQSREALSQVLYDSRSKQMVSTDGRRLTLIKCDLPVDRDFLLPASRFLSCSHRSELRLSCSDHSLHLSADNWHYSLKLRDIAYPDYRQVVPREDSFKGSVSMEYVQEDIQDLLGSAKVCHFLMQKEEVSLVVEDEAEPSAHMQLTARVQGTLPEIISVAPNYLMEALSLCGGSASIRLSGSHDPFLITSGNTQIVIMPLRNSNTQKVKTYIKGVIPMPKPESAGVTIIDKVPPMEQILSIVDSIEEKHKETKETLDQALKQVRDCQSQNKQIIKLVRLYERDVTKRLKDVKLAEELVARLQKIVA